MLLESPEDTAVLKDNITSPNGTTAAGLKALAESGGGEPIEQAVKQAAKRSKTISLELHFITPVVFFFVTGAYFAATNCSSSRLMVLDRFAACLTDKMTSNQQRVVVKVGSSSLTSLHGEISSKKLEKLVEQIVRLKDEGHE